ncbi:MAG TPA: imidazole glycerol phosphate synthase subunit HisH [Spirochaetota bacterium]|nr:imidazole glycerol phosphate synthase subunit HisH [Spirochaetota bacterium]
MITVIDYGMGNLRSVVKAVEKYTSDVRISRDPGSISSSTGLILPGDGAFKMAMEHLDSMGWTGPLKEYISGGGVFMGICLGFQLLFSTSEEFGESKGLDIIPGDVVKFRTPGLKVPHMGWNNVVLRNESQYLEGVDSGSYFYFIHTYYPEVKDRDWVIGEAEYGVTFPCIVGKGNVIATQFHPEKSHHVGLKIIENFVRKACS